MAMICIGWVFCVMAGMGVQLTLQHQVQCTVQTFNSSRAVGLTALYLGTLVNASKHTVSLKLLNPG